MAGRVLVLGIGNVLWADEGFGVRALAALHDGWRFPPEVDLVDGGTQGLYLLPQVQAAARILVLDAVDFRLAPGSLVVLRDGEIPARLSTGKVSPHQTSFQEVLALATLCGWRAEAVVLVGVQPAELRDFGGSLTAPVRAQLGPAVAAALETLAAWGVPGAPRAAPPDDGFLGPGLAMPEYEAGRPSAAQACRVGDARVLAASREAE